MESIEPPELSGLVESEAQKQSTVSKRNSPEKNKISGTRIEARLEAYQPVMYKYGGRGDATAQVVRFNARTSTWTA